MIAGGDFELAVKLGARLLDHDGKLEDDLSAEWQKYLERYDSYDEATGAAGDDARDAVIYAYLVEAAQSLRAKLDGKKGASAEDKEKEAIAALKGEGKPIEDADGNAISMNDAGRFALASAGRNIGPAGRIAYPLPIDPLVQALAKIDRPLARDAERLNREALIQLLLMRKLSAAAISSVGASIAQAIFDDPREGQDFQRVYAEVLPADHDLRKDITATEFDAILLAIYGKLSDDMELGVADDGNPYTKADVETDVASLPDDATKNAKRILAAQKVIIDAVIEAAEAQKDGKKKIAAIVADRASQTYVREVVEEPADSGQYSPLLALAPKELFKVRKDKKDATDADFKSVMLTTFVAARLSVLERDDVLKHIKGLNAADREKFLADLDKQLAVAVRDAVLPKDKKKKPELVTNESELVDTVAMQWVASVDAKLDDGKIKVSGVSFEQYSKTEHAPFRLIQALGADSNGPRRRRINELYAAALEMATKAAGEDKEKLAKFKKKIVEDFEKHLGPIVAKRDGDLELYATHVKKFDPEKGVELRTSHLSIYQRIKGRMDQASEEKKQVYLDYVAEVDRLYREALAKRDAEKLDIVDGAIARMINERYDFRRVKREHGSLMAIREMEVTGVSKEGLADTKRSEKKEDDDSIPGLKLGAEGNYSYAARHSGLNRQVGGASVSAAYQWLQKTMGSHTVSSTVSAGIAGGSSAGQLGHGSDLQTALAIPREGDGVDVGANANVGFSWAYKAGGKKDGDDEKSVGATYAAGANVGLIRFGQHGGPLGFPDYGFTGIRHGSPMGGFGAVGVAANASISAARFSLSAKAAIGRHTDATLKLDPSVQDQFAFTMPGWSAGGSGQLGLTIHEGSSTKLVGGAGITSNRGEGSVPGQGPWSAHGGLIAAPKVKSQTVGLTGGVTISRTRGLPDPGKTSTFAVGGGVALPNIIGNLSLASTAGYFSLDRQQPLGGQRTFGADGSSSEGSLDEIDQPMDPGCTPEEDGTLPAGCDPTAVLPDSVNAPLDRTGVQWNVGLTYAVTGRLELSLTMTNFWAEDVSGEYHNLFVGTGLGFSY